LGGGIYCFETSSTITNCTISENIASREGGGIYCRYSTPTITNSILWDDSPDEIYIESGTPVVTYSDIQSGWEGEGNIDADPRFVSYKGYEFILHPNSPCIDTGDPTIFDTLYDWHPLIPPWYKDGNRSNMGAYGGPGNYKWFK
jgi:parallel beta-helix repeat protein